jgi:hypothetical protein
LNDEQLAEVTGGSFLAGNTFLNLSAPTTKKYTANQSNLSFANASVFNPISVSAGKGGEVELTSLTAGVGNTVIQGNGTGASL